jgi:hypothetical protein
MPSRSLTLSDVAAETDVLAVACTRCDRAGRHSLEPLIKRYGAQFSVPNLLRLLSVGCPMRESVSPYALCGIYCLDFPRSALAKAPRRNNRAGLRFFKWGTSTRRPDDDELPLA